uniref:Uncharacterized protein n=1 Tax=Psilocybe cubensis TaxID=181762 RepID=A0A8H8CF73_PSICU
MDELEKLRTDMKIYQAFQTESNRRRAADIAKLNRYFDTLSKVASKTEQRLASFIPFVITTFTLLYILIFSTS